MLYLSLLILLFITFYEIYELINNYLISFLFRISGGSDGEELKGLCTYC